MRLRAPAPAHVLTWVAAGLGACVTAVVVGTPYLSFGYHSPALHMLLDSVDACVALLLAYLLYGRFRRGRLLADALLANSLLMFAVAGPWLELGLGDLNGARAHRLDVWLPLTVRVVAALLVAAAALARTKPAGHGGARRAVLAAWLPLALAGVALFLLRGHLPVAVTGAPVGLAPMMAAHPLLVAAHGLSAVCFMAASGSFTVRAARGHDELLRWLGPAFALAAFARVNYMLFPSLYTDWLYTGDLLRTGCYALMLVGAAREIRQYWSAQARAAVLEDRRRLARELHDGVVQELGYIRSLARSTVLGDTAAAEVVGACERALDEARGAIHALGHGPDEPLGVVLHRTARQVEERYGGRVVVDLDDSVDVDDDQRHALVRITREAVSNAIRHGKAECTRIELSHVDGRRSLVVSDNGGGFDPQALAGSGYGLTSMRDRAAGLPGSFKLESVPGAGTTVVVTW
jgi:signal transduction histidine kinase